MKKTLVGICSDLDASLYLKDWLSWHWQLGYDDAVVYLNNVNLMTKNMLKETYFKIPVDFRTIDGSVRQLDAYNDFLRHNDSDFATVIDVDEFVTIRSTLDLSQIFFKYSKCPAIAANWRLFGSNGLKEWDNRPVWERFTKCEKSLNKHVKMLMVNLKMLRESGLLDRVKFVSPHCLNIHAFNLEGEHVVGPFNTRNLAVPHEVEISHYATKSEAECRVRRSMSRADINGPREEGWEAFFRAHDKNDIEASEI